jgi:N-ethylmaleimide reductase
VSGRTRLVCEVMDAIAAEIGADRTGIRVSPVTPSNGAPPDGDAQATYGAVAAHARRLGLAFMEVVEGATGGAREFHGFDFQALKAEFGGPWIVNNGYTRQMALDVVASGEADLGNSLGPATTNRAEAQNAGTPGATSTGPSPANTAGPPTSSIN